MTSAWHVTPAQAASYADGSLPELDAWSVDKHLEACTPCAARVSAAARAGTAAPALAAVRIALLAAATTPDGVAPAPAPARPLRPSRLRRLARRAGASAAGVPASSRPPRHDAPDAWAGVGRADDPGERPMGPGGHDATAVPGERPVGAGHRDADTALAAARIGNGAPEEATVPPDAPSPARHTRARPGVGTAAAEGPGTAPVAARIGDGAAAPTAPPGAPSSARYPGAGAGAADGPGAPPVGTTGGVPVTGPAAVGRRAVSYRLVGGGRGALLSRLAWAAGPAVRGSWLISLLVMAIGAVCAARAAGIGGVRPFLLLLAPVLPSAGVAVSYGRHADPMHEIGASTPSGGLRLLLARTAAVLAVSVPLLTLAGLLLPATAGGPGAAAWLLPGLALTLAALALGSYVGCRAATAVVSAVWLLAVGAPAATASPGLLPGALAESLAAVLSGPAAQGCWAAAAAGCAGLLVLRRTSFDHLERI